MKGPVDRPVPGHGGHLVIGSYGISILEVRDRVHS